MNTLCAILKRDGQQPIVALNLRQSDTILENSPKGDSQSNGAVEKAVRETEGMIRTWKMSAEEKVEGSD